MAAADGRGQQTRRHTILCQLGCGVGCVVLSGTRARPAPAPAGRRPAGRVTAACGFDGRGGHQLHPRSAGVKTAGRERASCAGWEAERSALGCRVYLR